MSTMNIFLLLILANGYFCSEYFCIIPFAEVPSEVVPPEVVLSKVVPSAVVPYEVVPPELVPSTVVSSTVVPSAVVPSTLVPSELVPSTVAPSAVFPSEVVPPEVVHFWHSTEECKAQLILIKEIIEDVNEMKDLKTSFFVGNVITSENCTLENFCKAGEVLSDFKAEMFGLDRKDWQLPKKLVAYSRKTTCNATAVKPTIAFHQLLHYIKLCAMKEYKKTCS